MKQTILKKSSPHAIIFLVALLFGLTLLFIVTIYKQSLINYPELSQQLQQNEPTSASSNFQPKVITINLNPVEGNRNLDQTYYNLNGKTPDEYAKYYFNQYVEDFKQLSDQKINYQIVKNINISNFPKYDNNQTFTIDSYAKCVWGTSLYNPAQCETLKANFNHQSWINDNHICEIANQYRADEIWFISAPYIARWESFMIGPTDGFWVNAPSYITPTCKKHLVVMNAAVDRPENFLHNYGHRVESFMTYISDQWQPKDKQSFWTNFAIVDPKLLQNSPNTYITKPICGQVHYPANAAYEYDYTNHTVRANTCADWNSFPYFSKQTSMWNCEKWGCSDRGWQKLWLSSLPHVDLQITRTSLQNHTFQLSKNWWNYLLYPENTISLNNYMKTGIPPAEQPLPAPVSNLSCPENFKAICKVEGNGVSISWNAIPGAKKYQVRANKYPFNDWANVPAGDQGVVVNTNNVNLNITPNTSYDISVQGIKSGEAYPYKGCQESIKPNVTCSIVNELPLPVPPLPLPDVRGLTLKISAAGTPAQSQYPILKIQQVNNDKVVTLLDNILINNNLNDGYKEYVVKLDTLSSISDITNLRFVFTNDYYSNKNGLKEDRNLFIQKVTAIDRTGRQNTFNSNDPKTFSMGSWNKGTGCAPGYKLSYMLSCKNAFFQYYSPVNNTSIPKPTPKSSSKSSPIFSSKPSPLPTSKSSSR